MKKTLTIVPALALMFAFSASFAFASDRDSHHKNSERQPLTAIFNANEAHTLNNINSLSNTGNNAIDSSSNDAQAFNHDDGKDKGKKANIASILSGDAASSAWADTTANNTSVEVAAPTDGKTFVTNLNKACTENNISSRAKTGRNIISGNGETTISTGGAMSEASAITLTNSSVVKITN